MSSRWFSVLWSVGGEKAGNTRQNSVKYLTRERRNRWISAVSRGDTAKKNILESERVCDRHFV